jgi:hypothetical protein
MNDNEHREYLRRQRKSRNFREEPGWPLLGIGVVSVVTAAAFSLATDLRALPVFLAMLIFPGMPVLQGIVLPAALFICYNIATIGSALNNVKSYTTTLTGILIFSIGTLSLLYYALSWQYRDVYQSASTVDTWAVINAILALLTVCLWVRAVRYPTPVRAIVSHIAMFVWFFSFAFPHIGESI